MREKKGRKGPLIYFPKISCILTVLLAHQYKCSAKEETGTYIHFSAKDRPLS